MTTSDSPRVGRRGWRQENLPPLRTKRPSPQSVAERVALTLRKEILLLPDGHHLGLEDDLLLRLEVSRPTFRQSARLLMQEQLLEVRRGVGGGYYTTRPRVESVSDVAATYLAIAGADLLHLLEAASALTTYMLQSAARSKDPVGRSRLAAVVATMRVEEVSGEIHLSSDDEMTAALLMLADNPAIELFIRMIYSFGTRETELKIFKRRSDRMQRWRSERLDLGRAVLSGDAELAQALGVRQARLIETWVREDALQPQRRGG